METFDDAGEQGQVNLDKIVEQTYAQFTGWQPGRPRFHLKINQSTILPSRRCSQGRAGYGMIIVVDFLVKNGKSPRFNTHDALLWLPAEWKDGDRPEIKVVDDWKTDDVWEFEDFPHPGSFSSVSHIYPVGHPFYEDEPQQTVPSLGTTQTAYGTMQERTQRSEDSSR